MKGCFKLQGVPTEKSINYKRVTIGKEAIEVDEGLEELSGTYIKKPCRSGFYYERNEPSPMFIYRKGRKQWWYFNDELDSDVSYLQPQVMSKPYRSRTTHFSNYIFHGQPIEQKLLDRRDDGRLFTLRLFELSRLFMLEVISKISCSTF